MRFSAQHSRDALRRSAVPADHVRECHLAELVPSLAARAEVYVICTRTEPTSTVGSSEPSSEACFVFYSLAS